MKSRYYYLLGLSLILLFAKQLEPAVIGLVPPHFSLVRIDDTSELESSAERSLNEAEQTESSKSSTTTHDFGIEIINATTPAINNKLNFTNADIKATKNNNHLTEEGKNHSKTLRSEIVLRTQVVRTPLGLSYNDRVVRELCEHFTFDEPSVISLGALLIRVKQLAHNKVYGNRVFGSDSESDRNKEVSTSEIQPITRPELAPFLFEGDILLSEPQANSILAHIQKQRSSRSLSSDPEAIWRQMPIRFRFHDSLGSIILFTEFFAITQIVEAVRFWEDSTCIRFEHIQERLSETEDHIEFFKGQGCYSMIGRYGGRQGISIGSGCERTGIVEHEIGHILGLWHEQSRPDAERYVDIRKEYILPSYMSDFQLRGTDEIITLGVPYDYGSVMHYGPTAFSSDGVSLTLITKNELYQTTIGQRERLSFFDIQIINKVYCGDKCIRRPPNAKGSKYHDYVVDCRNGGYPHPKNCSRCMCPSGYGGDDCSTFAPPKNAECGGIFNVNAQSWREIQSPGYDADGYEEDQRCNWIIRSPRGTRVEAEFHGEFSFLCGSICLDFVELKLSGDQRTTGARFCCDDRPEGSFVSESNQMAIIFRSQASQDRGFQLQLRATVKLPTPSFKSMAEENKPEETRSTTTVLPGRNMWSNWGEWSACSRSCGGCGIRSRIRVCLTTECDNKNQEFGACNFQACPIKLDCNKVSFLNRVCRRDVSSTVCSNLSAKLNECYKPSCCPPFFAVDGKCITNLFDTSESIAEI